MKNIVNQIFFDHDIFQAGMTSSRVSIEWDLPYESILQGNTLKEKETYPELKSTDSYPIGEEINLLIEAA